MRAQYRNDILRQHGIIPEKPKDPEPLIQEALIAAQHRAHENRLEDQVIDEVDALEEEEDEEFLQKYRYDTTHEDFACPVVAKPRQPRDHANS